MTKIKDVEEQRDILHVASRLLERHGGGMDIIMDEIGGFTSIRFAPTDPPAELIKAVADWIGDFEVSEPEE